MNRRRIVTRPNVLRLALALSLVAGFTGAVPAGGWARQAARPVPSTVRTVPVTPAAVADLLGDGALTPPSRPAPSVGKASDTQGFTAGGRSAEVTVSGGVTILGVTWTGEDKGGAAVRDDRLQVRTRVGGAWGPWVDLTVDSGHGPDAARPEGAGTSGTDPFVAIAADSVQARVFRRSGGFTTSLVVVEPGRSAADTQAASGAGGSAHADAVRPTIRSRAEWGADESLVQEPPSYAQAHLVFVHHTAGANTYQPADVPAILRGIMSFHVLGRGWNDIGYNALVDKFGTIWEGRAGGLDQAVVGAHTLGHNSWSFGVSVLGDYTQTPPTLATLDALARYVAWKFTLHGDPVYGQVFASDGLFNRISGHRDGQQTDCPGQLLYDQLPTIRTKVAALVGQLSVTPLNRSVNGDGYTDVLVYPVDAAGAQTAAGVIALGSGPAPIAGRAQVGTGWWGNLTDVSISDDLTGDGHADLITVERASGTLRIYEGNGAAGVLSTRILSGFGGYDLVLPAGDRDGDGAADLLARSSTGDLLLLRGTGRGTFASPSRIGIGWGGVRVLAPGDLTGDGVEDVFLVDSAGNLWLYPGANGGGFSGPRVLWGVGWQSLTLITAARDLDGDGFRGDLVARDSSGRMRTYYADRSGRLSRTNTWGAGWQGIGQIAVGDWNGDGHPDLVGTRPSDGALLLYEGTGRRDFMATRSAPSVPNADLVRLVGDVNADGYSDAVARVAGGDLMGLWGEPGGSFSAPFRVGTGWQGADLIAAIGDYTRDGVPDLVIRLPATGRTISYPMTRSFGFLKPMPFDSGWTDLVSITVGGTVNPDANLDLVALDAAGTLWLQPGSGPSSTLDRISLLSGQTDLAELLGVGDMTGDGWPDLIARTTTGPVVMYPGGPGQTFGPSRSVLRGPWGASTSLG